MPEAQIKEPVFSRRISLGNILTGVGLVSAIAAGWFGMQASIAATEAELGDIKDEMLRLNGGQRAVIARVRSNEIAIIRQDERWNQISQFMARIEGSIERINQQIQQSQRSDR